jgi:biotin carboxyl carrier protein
VTPTSQIVGIQTVNNVLFDDGGERYKMITAQVKDLCFGLYGKTPVRINPEVRQKALKGYERGEEPITCRPAEILEAELEKAQKETEGLAGDLDDVLIGALYPVTGKRFLKWKCGKEQPPDDVKPRTLEEVKAEEELIKKAKAGKLIEKSEKQAPPKGEKFRAFNVFVDDEYFEVGVEEVGGASAVSYVQPTPTQKSAGTAARRAPAVAAAAPETEAPKLKAEKILKAETPPELQAPGKVNAKRNGTPLTAPMPGMIVRFEKNVGDSVNEGEAVVILEAMKMENSLPAPVSGTIEVINLRSGDSVTKGDVLCVIGQ